MNYVLIFQLLIIAAGLYVLGLIGYRLKISAAALKNERDRLLANIQEIKSAPNEDPAAAETTRSDELVGLLQKRRQNRKDKAKKAAETERRLIKHLGSM